VFALAMSKFQNRIVLVTKHLLVNDAKQLIASKNKPII